MPDMDGIEAAGASSRAPACTRLPTIVMVTAYGREEVMEQAEDAGFEGILIKPVSQSVLLNTIMEVFGRGGTVSPSRRRRRRHPRARSSRSAGARLLVAEDNEINQQVAREILESAGLVVELADNGPEAAARGREPAAYRRGAHGHPDARDGRPAGDPRDARDAGSRDLPIIAMTAHAMASDREKSLEAGMNDHVTKPIDPDTLIAVLLRWVRPGERAAVPRPSPPRPDAAMRRKATGPGAGSLPGIDRTTGLRRVAGNEALQDKLLLDFHRDYATSIDHIRAAIGADRLSDAERLVHTLKGVAGNIGAMDLQRKAEELDSALRLGEQENAGALLSDVERELSVVIRGLEPFARRAETARAEAEVSGAGARGPVDRPALESALRALADRVRKNDPEAEDALGHVRGMLKGARNKEVKRIAQALDLFDFRGAARALTALADAEGVSLGP